MQRDVVIGAGVLVAAIAGATVLLVKDARRVAMVDAVRAPSSVIDLPQAPRIAPPQRELPQPVPVEIAPPVEPPVVSVAPTTSQAWMPAPQGRRAPAAAADAPVTVPVARDALSWVGADPAADDVYVAAINNPNLAPNDRKNLIEDLNETGFDDPRNLTQNDLPVIEYRLAMIEQLAPSAMDDVNAAAFQEAYKDLTNMRTRIVGQ